MKKKWFQRKEQKELEGKIESKKAQLEKVKTTLDLIPAQHGYQNALEVTKAMKTAQTELKKVQLALKAWDTPEPESEKMYLRILANVRSAVKRVMQNSTGKKRSIHERLEEKKHREASEWIKNRRIWNCKKCYTNYTGFIKCSQSPAKSGFSTKKANNQKKL